VAGELMDTLTNTDHYDLTFVKIQKGLTFFVESKYLEFVVQDSFYGVGGSLKGRCERARRSAADPYANLT
jgi:hypothetical protein